MLWKSFSGQVYWYKQILLFIMKDSKLNLDVSCLILFFISLIVFFNSPNFILETAICPVTSDGAGFISYVSCFRTLSRLFSALHGTRPLCHISSFSTSREVWLAGVSPFCHSGYLLGRGGGPWSRSWIPDQAVWVVLLCFWARNSTFEPYNAPLSNPTSCVYYLVTGKFKGVRANCFCASLLRAKFTRYAR